MILFLPKPGDLWKDNHFELKVKQIINGVVVGDGSALLQKFFLPGILENNLRKIK